MAKLTESKSTSFNVSEELVRLGVEFTDAADRLQKFISKEFYSKASAFEPNTAKSLIAECKARLSQIEAMLPKDNDISMETLRREFTNILSGIRGGRINVDYTMMAGAKAIYSSLLERSENFRKIVDYLDDEFFDEFHAKDNREAVTALILVLKKMKVIK